MKTKLLSILLALVMLLGVLPGMSMTAKADNTCTVTFKANGRTVSKEVTLPHTFSCNYSSENGEFDLIIKELYQLDGGCCGLNPPTVSGSTNVTGGISGDNQYITVNAPFEGTATFDSVYFDSSKGYMDFEIHLEISCTGAVAAYSVTITAGDHMTKTADSGKASQTDLSGAMTDVVYTANDGYYFPEDYAVTVVNGISVTRNSYTQITVSGTPAADAEITLTAPTAKTTPDAPTTAAAVDCTTADNNDGKLTGVTTAMEYKKSDAADWTAGTGSDITDLVPGTYYVRVKATDTTNASGNQELTINAASEPAGYLKTTNADIEESLLWNVYFHIDGFDTLVNPKITVGCAADSKIDGAMYGLTYDEERDAYMITVPIRHRLIGQNVSFTLSDDNGSYKLGLGADGEKNDAVAYSFDLYLNEVEKIDGFANIVNALRTYSEKLLAKWPVEG